MKLKTIEIDGKTYAQVQDGQPVYVHDDGKESPFDAAGTIATIRARNAEAKSNRERAETAEAALKTFEGIDDAVAVVVEFGQGIKAVGRALAVPEQGVVAKEFATGIDAPVAVEVAHQQAVSLPHPAAAFGVPGVVQVEEVVLERSLKA